MALNFPNTPTNGQVFTASSGLTYQYNGTVWEVAQTGFALPFNYVVNPAMLMSQEDGGAANNYNAHCAADQWFCAFNGWPTVDSARVAGTTQILFGAYYLSFYAPMRALAAADYALWQQNIEGYRVASLQWGTPSAKQIVVRFTCNCAPAGTYAIGICNGPGARSYVVPFAPGPGEQEYIFAIPGDTGGTWAVDNSIGLSIRFCPAAGTTFLTTPNVWQAGNFLGQTGMTNITASGGGTFNIGRVGLYADPLKTGRAPPWQMVEPVQNALNCQRYWFRLRNAKGVTTASWFGRGRALVPTAMRIAPGISIAPGALPYGWDALYMPTFSSLNNISSEQIVEFDGNGFSAGAVAGGAMQMLPDYEGSVIVNARF